jgi:hypothetical protein
MWRSFGSKCKEDLQIAMRENWVAVLGQRDAPTDGVEEYCRYLGTALTKYGIELTLIRVPWAELGWTKAIGQLEQQVLRLRARWVLIQYTALAWSRRGLPWEVAGLVRSLKKEGVLCGAVFHDPVPYAGSGLRNGLRRMVQVRTMRNVARLADCAVLTIPLDRATWLPRDVHKALFIPVGANLPKPERAWELSEQCGKDTATIAVFSITGGEAGNVEMARITEALGVVWKKIGRVRLVVFGRNADVDGLRLKEKLAGTPTEVVIHGLLEPGKIIELLGGSDVMLFVRGPISTRRGSALAGIACGLPVVAYAGWETAGPVTEAGVVLVEQGSGVAAGEAIVRILQDEAYRQELQKRSRQAQEQFFSWDAIAAAYATALNG